MSYYDHATMMAHKLGPWAEPNDKVVRRIESPRRKPVKLSAFGTLYERFARMPAARIFMTR